MLSSHTCMASIEEHIEREVMAVEEFDLENTAMLVLDMQNLIVDPDGAGYVESVAGAPSGQDVVERTQRILESVRDTDVDILWSKWGLRPDGADAGIAAEKWPFLNCGKPDSPVAWGHRDSEITDELDPRDDEIVFEKHRFSSMYDTPMDEFLREWDDDHLVIVGVTSANCMVATAIDAWNKNYHVTVVGDCSTAVPHPGEEPPEGYGQHWEALRNIQMNYGDVRTTEEFLEKVEAARAEVTAD